MMPMTFWAGYKENELIFLFPDLKTKSDLGYVMGLIGTFLFAFFVEGTMFTRSYLKKLFLVKNFKAIVNK